MATFGNYESVTELHSGERGSVFSARPVGGGREIKYAVKTFSPRALDMDEQFWEGQSFAERARVQQRAAEAGGSHWAPIHETGTSPAGTYYVTDFHPLSAASLVTGRVDVSAGVLYAIVRSVVSGLDELKAAAGRAHGNLKATNILINSRGDVAVAGAVLTDPAPAADAARAGEAGDLHALGDLIHLLVTGHRFRPGQWPLEPTREWLRLGRRQGRLWRRLCNDLLSPDPSLRPAGLDEVSKRLRRLVPRRARPSRRLSLAVAAMVVVIAAGAAALLGIRDAGARKEVCAAKARWAGDLTAALNDPNRRKLLESDPDVIRVVRELDQADLANFDCDGSGAAFGINPNLRNFRQTRDTLQAVRRAERGLSPIQWRQLARAAELQGRFEARGWTKPAQHLAQRIAAARPGSKNIAEGIERFLVALAAVDRDLPKVEEQWVHLQTRTRDLEETRDKTMARFAAYLRDTAAASVELSDAGFGSLDGTRDAAVRADGLYTAFRQLTPPHYDSERFNAEVVRYIAERDRVQGADIDRWLSAIPAYRIQEEKIRPAVAELRREADRLVAQALDSGVDAKDDKDFSYARSRADHYIGKLAAGRFIQRDIDDKTFEAAKEEAAKEVAALTAFVRTENVAEWLKKLPAPDTASAALNAFWDDAKDKLTLTAQRFADQPGHIKVLQEETRRLRDVLVALDEEVPQAPPAAQWNDELFDEAARQKREAVFAWLLEEGTPAALSREPEAAQRVRAAEAVKAAAAAYAKWTADLAELRKDFPLRQRLLTPDVRPDEAWAKANPDFWNDRIVQTVVSPYLKRIDAIRGMEAMSRDALVKAAQTERREELALHAWRLLGADGVTPAWPTRPGELAAEDALRRRLVDLLRPLAQGQDAPVAAEAAKAAAELKQEAARRWQRFAAAAGADEGMLSSAAALRGASGVTAEQFAALPAEARFNVSLADVRRRLRDRAVDGLEAAFKELRAAAAQVKDATLAQDLGRRLARADEKEPFASEALGDEHPVTLPGTQEPLVFRRVSPQSRRPFYLATAEVSFAQFAAAMEAGNAWDDLRSLMWSPQPGDIGDPRRGPRVWEWVTRPAPPRMYKTTLWLSPDDANDYPKEFRQGRFNAQVLADAVGGNPDENHPVQYVPAEAAMYFAALAGCRLPTADEWRAAFEAHEKPVPTAEWNLRDQTWQVQRDHVAAALAARPSAANGHAPRFPDEGIYLPAQPRAAVGAAATAHPQRDGTLFFRPTGGTGGRTFRHLAGNVAEFVCDIPEPLEQLADKSAQRVKALAAEAGPRLSVIGGSALSPPEVPWDVPHPVKPGAAFADVGFRVAFTAPSRDLAEKLEWVLAGQGFLPPSGADDTARAQDTPPRS